MRFFIIASLALSAAPVPSMVHAAVRRKSGRKNPVIREKDKEHIDDSSAAGDDMPEVAPIT